MLENLDVRNFARFCEVALQFPQSGFCVLTGETGAGKSLLLGALATAVGGKFSERSIRAGAESAEVSVLFALPENKARLLKECGCETDDGQLLIRRVLERQRRVRSYINGSACTAAQIGRIGEGLIALFRQHEHILLHSADRRREMLDRFANCEQLAAKVADHHASWKKADLQLSATREKQAEMAAERQQLEQAVTEVEDGDQSRQKYAECSQVLSESANAAELSQLQAQILSELANADASCRRSRQAAERIREISREAGEASAGIIGEAEALVADALRTAKKMLDEDRQHDSALLAKAEEYVSEAHRLMRRHHCVSPEALFDYIEQIRGQLAELGDASLAAAEEEEARLRQAWRQAASGLSDKRRQAASRLGQRVGALMHKLGMPGGSFEVVINPYKDERPRPSGGEQIDFVFAARSSEQLRSVEDAASGGELSRLALALYSLCSTGSGQALVFDEIDSGIGGRIAAAVGAVLAAMGRKRLVLAITHLPQVAAAADCHWHIRIGKSGATEIRKLDSAARAEEIARMLAGRRITEASRRNAREIIESARII